MICAHSSLDINTLSQVSGTELERPETSARWGCRAGNKHCRFSSNRTSLALLLHLIEFSFLLSLLKCSSWKWNSSVSGTPCSFVEIHGHGTNVTGSRTDSLFLGSSSQYSLYCLLLTFLFIIRPFDGRWFREREAKITKLHKTRGPGPQGI